LGSAFSSLNAFTQHPDRSPSINCSHSRVTEPPRGEGKAFYVYEKGAMVAEKETSV
jgi:hypothetical protein